MGLQVLDALLQHLKVAFALTVAPGLGEGIDNVDLVRKGRVVVLEDGKKRLAQEIVVFSQQHLGCGTRRKVSVSYKCWRTFVDCELARGVCVLMLL